MAFNTQSSLGGAGTNADSIVMKALREEVSNESRKDAYVYSNAKTMPVGDVDYRFAVDEYKTPTGATKAENYTITASDAQSDSRKPYQATAQINGTTIGSSNTANAVKQAGGPTQNYNLGKQLVEITHDYEFQATSTGSTSIQSATGTRRTASIAAYAGVVSSNGSPTQNDSSAALTGGTALRPRADGNHYFAAGTAQGVAALLVDEAIETAAGKFKQNWDMIVVPTSLRMGTSAALKNTNSLNRYTVDASSKKAVQAVSMYDTDFGQFGLMDSWIMGLNGASDSMYILDSSALRRGVVRDLQENEEVVSNSDGQLQEYVMENMNFVANQSCAIHIRNLSATATAASAKRGTTNVQRAVLLK